MAKRKTTASNPTAAPRAAASKRDRRSNSVLRYVLVSGLILFFASLIVRSALKTTVWEREAWNQKANKGLSRVDTIAPLRGDILAANGAVLATNVNSYNVRIDFKSSQFMDSEFRRMLPALADTLALLHGIRSAAEWQQRLEAQVNRPKDQRSHHFLLLADLTHQQAEAVKGYPFFRLSKNPNRTGYVQEKKVKRIYPYGAMARRSVGRVSELKNGHLRGYSGLEYALDSLLYGRPGVYKKVPLTRNIVNWTDVPAQNGYTLTTTIDVAMQDIVEHELINQLQEVEGEWGTCILMEVNSGDIKAISNFERDSTGAYIEAQNHALLGYEPGSVMKAISMVIALEDGFAPDIHKVYNCPQGYVFGGGKGIRDHTPAQCEVYRFLEVSSNIGMTKLVAPHFADNPNRYRERVAQLGLLDRFNTGIAGERPAYFPTLDPKRGWLNTLARQTYGYCAQIPPLYTCAFYNAIANDGKFVRPRLISKIRTPRGDSIIPVSYVRPQICSPENAQLMREMLLRVVYGDKGTARRVMRDPLVKIAGKTGTSSVAIERKRTPGQKPTAADSVDKARPSGYNEQENRFAFCGFFPYDNPRYTCMVMISRPNPRFRNAALVSGTVLKGIARKMYSRGMLGNKSEYRDGTPSQGSQPTVYATTGAQSANVKGMLGTTTARRIVTQTTAQGVPDVTGLGLRQALVALENAGYNVTYTGSGYVSSQSPPGGTLAGKGTKVNLTLVNQ